MTAIWLIVLVGWGVLDQIPPQMVPAVFESKAACEAAVKENIDLSQAPKEYDVKVYCVKVDK